MTNDIWCEAVEAYCSLRCPSVFTSPDQPRHTETCEALRAAALLRDRSADERADEGIATPCDCTKHRHCPRCHGIEIDDKGGTFDLCVDCGYEFSEALRGVRDGRREEPARCACGGIMLGDGGAHSRQCPAYEWLAGPDGRRSPDCGRCSKCQLPLSIVCWGCFNAKAATVPPDRIAP